MASSNVVCSKCGATGKSKCPYCRNVFPDNGYEALLSHIFHFYLVEEGGLTKAKITYVIDPEWSPEQAWKHIHGIIHEVDERVGVKMLLCEHDFIFAPGEVSEIGCGHVNRMFTTTSEKGE